MWRQADSMRPAQLPHNPQKSQCMIGTSLETGLRGRSKEQLLYRAGFPKTGIKSPWERKQRKLVSVSQTSINSHGGSSYATQHERLPCSQERGETICAGHLFCMSGQKSLGLWPVFSKDPWTHLPPHPTNRHICIFCNVVISPYNKGMWRKCTTMNFCSFSQVHFPSRVFSMADSGLNLLV